MFALIFSLGCYVGQSKNCLEIENAHDRDACYMNEIQMHPSSEMNAVIEKGKRIEDSMIRGAAISAWVRDNNNQINQVQGKQLCMLLDGRDRSYCMRRFSSPHLK